MIKTNLMYGAAIIDNGSSLPDSSFFTNESLRNLKIRKSFTQGQFIDSSTWGNAQAPVDMLFKASVSFPSGVLSETLSSVGVSWGDLTVLKERLSPNGGAWSIDSFGVDFGAPKFVDTIRILLGGPAAFYTGSSSITKFGVYTSADNISWTLLASFPAGVAITKGAALFSFTRTLAGYFKITPESIPTYVLRSVASLSVGFYPQKLFFLDTTLNQELKLKIDLGKNYKATRLFINSHHHRKERSDVVVESSTDDIVYNNHADETGELQEPLATAPIPGKIYWDERKDKILLVGSGALYHYDLTEDSWSLVKSDANIPSSFGFSGYDSKNRVVYLLDSGTLEFRAYYIDEDIFVSLPDAPFPLNDKSSAAFALDSFFYVTPPNRSFEVIDSFSLQMSAVQFSTITNTWKTFLLRGFNNNTLARSLLTLDGVKDVRGIVASFFSKTSPFLLVAGPSVGSFVASIDLHTGDSRFTGTGSSTGFFNLPYFNWTENDTSPKMLAIDTDRGFILAYMSNTGLEGVRFRNVDSILDMKFSNFYGPTSSDSLSSEKNLFDVGGPPIGLEGNIIYSPATQKYYKIGWSDGNGSAQVFVSLDSDYLVTMKRSLIEDVRYIKIENTSSTTWPVIWESITVIEDDNNVRYGPGPFVLRKDVEFAINQAGTPEPIEVFNDHSLTTTSGISFLEPDGSEGSRYYQIGATSSGTFISHCVFNDLDTFECTASNTNYNTESCGIVCTSGTGGGGATGEYTTDFIEVGSIISSGTQTFYTRSFLPSGTLGENRKFFITTELYE